MKNLTITSTISENANDAKRSSSVTSFSHHEVPNFYSQDLLQPERLVGMPQGKAGQEITKAAKTAWDLWDAKQNQTEVSNLKVHNRDYNSVPPKRIYSVRARSKFIGRGQPLRQTPDEE